MNSFATASTAEKRRFLRTHVALPGVAFAALALALELSSFDRRVAGLFFSRPRGVWLGGRSWWANELLHDGGRKLVAVVAAAALLLTLGAALSGRWARFGRPALFVLASVALGTGLVALLKSTTNVDCPRDLALFAGQRPYVRLLEAKPAGAPRGRCWPGGHSSGAFSLLALYFVVRESRSGGGASRLALAAVLSLGLAFAFGQWARGAHFVSHDLWSATICWFSALALYLVPFRGRVGDDDARKEADDVALSLSAELASTRDRAAPRGAGNGRRRVRGFPGSLEG